MQTKKLLIGLGLLAGIVAMTGSTTACTVTTTITCGGSDVDCNGICRDLSIDDNNCGACGYACLAGDFCSGGACVTGVCLNSGDSCASDCPPSSDCSACCGAGGDYFCAGDSHCGCMPLNTIGCNPGDCCSPGVCGSDGVCH